MTSPDDPARALAEEGAKARAYIAASRSETLLRIFDYLLQQAIKGQIPRETDIAAEVFADGLTNPGQQGSRVRVSVHRLRKKLQAFGQDTSGCQLIIPPGEYALQLVMPPVAQETVAPPAVPRRASGGWRNWCLAVAALLALNAAAAWVYAQRTGQAGDVAQSPLWSGIVSGKDPTALVVGEHFAFLMNSPDTSEAVLIQDFAVTSPEELYAYTASHPVLSGQVVDQNLYTVSASILGAVSHLAGNLSTVRIDPKTSQSLTPETMQSSHVIYIGQLDEMSSLLRTPLREASGFRCGPHCYDLVDKASDRRFASDSPYVLGDSIVPRRDYAYIARFPGPSGHAVLLISGTGDAAVRQSARIVTDPAMIEELRRRVGGDLTSFEALYQVRTMFDQTYGSKLLIARPVKSDHIWDLTKPD